MIFPLDVRRLCFTKANMSEYEQICQSNMSEYEQELSEGEVTANQCGLILGCWDHEKTPTLIQDLEHSVDLVERKCKNLLEELIYYKKYLEESEQPVVHLADFKKKGKKWKRCNLFSGSDPDIAYRKSLISFQETQQLFQEKFQEKLQNINKELGAAAHKLGLGDSIILFPTDEYRGALNRQTEEKVRRSWTDVRDKFLKLNSFKVKTKSDSLLSDTAGNEPFAKITRNQLQLYRDLSRLSHKKGTRFRPRMLPSKGRKFKFCCRKRTPRFSQGLSGCRASAKRESRSCREKKEKRRKKRSAEEAPLQGGAPQSTGKSSGTQRMSKCWAEEVGGKKGAEGGVVAEEEQILGVVMRKAVPFTACTSTSRSYNIGLNIQQLLSLSKRSGKPGMRVRMSEQSEEMLERCWRGKEVERDAERRAGVARAVGSKRSELECGEVSRVEDGGKVCMRKRESSSKLRKVRSKYTGNSPGGFMEYHKSTMRQYISGQKSMMKSESKSAYAVGSKILVSGCQRTDVFEMGKDELGMVEKASGDGKCNKQCAKLNADWARVYSSFLSVYRKYVSLKEKLSDKDSSPSDEELKCVEKEIDEAIGKYKDFIQFYSKFLHLKHRLKSLKIACETKVIGPVTSFTSNWERKVGGCRTTYSMTIKRAFQEVQALQDKIRLIGD